jgi:hypothetical protein
VKDLDGFGKPRPIFSHEEVDPFDKSLRVVYRRTDGSRFYFRVPPKKRDELPAKLRKFIREASVTSEG